MRLMRRVKEPGSPTVVQECLHFGVFGFESVNLKVVYCADKVGTSIRSNLLNSTSDGGESSESLIKDDELKSSTTSTWIPLVVRQVNRIAQRLD